MRPIHDAHGLRRNERLAWRMHLISPMQAKVIRRRLLRRRRELLARYRDEIDRADELDSHDPEVIERATEQWDAQVLAKLGDADASALGEISAALQRLDSGDYGTCTTCHEPINRARLAALPATPLCIGCADEARPTQPVRVRRTG